MIFSKSSLQVCGVTCKSPTILDNVYFTGKGEAIAFDGKVLVIVSPVLEETKEKISLASSVLNDSAEPMTISADSIREVLKSMPSDRKFNGLLNHVDLNSKGVFKWTDGGNREKSLGSKTQPSSFLDYEGILRKAKSVKPVNKVVLNRHRLRTLLDFMDKACPDSSKECPIYLEFSEENDLTVRSLNGVTGQVALGVMACYKNQEGKWLEPSDWERRFEGSNAENKPKRIPAPRRIPSKS